MTMTSARQQEPAASAGQAEYPHDAVWDALREVEDPEMGVSIVDLGLVVTAERHGSRVDVKITYTAMGCPATELIAGDVVAHLRRLAGVDDVSVEVVWDPVWTKSRLTADACDALQLVGVTI